MCKGIHQIIVPHSWQAFVKVCPFPHSETRSQEFPGSKLTPWADAAVYEDTLNGCPSRSTNTAGVDDAAAINANNPRAYRPTQLTPLDSTSSNLQPLNSTFDPW